MDQIVSPLERAVAELVAAKKVQNTELAKWIKRRLPSAEELRKILEEGEEPAERLRKGDGEGLARARRMLATPELPALARGRTGIAGRIEDATSKAPLPGLGVAVMSRGEEEVVLGTATSGRFGEFLVVFDTQPASGRLRVVVAGPDGRPVYDRERNVHLTPNLPDEVNISIRAGTRLAGQRKAGKRTRATVEKSDARLVGRRDRAKGSRKLVLAQAERARRSLAKLGERLSDA